MDLQRNTRRLETPIPSYFRPVHYAEDDAAPAFLSLTQGGVHGPAAALGPAQGGLHEPAVPAPPAAASPAAAGCLRDTRAPNPVCRGANGATAAAPRRVFSGAAAPPARTAARPEASRATGACTCATCVRLDPPKERSSRSPLTFPVSRARPLFRSSKPDSCIPHTRTPFVTTSSCSPLLTAWQILLAASYDGI